MRTSVSSPRTAPNVPSNPVLLNSADVPRSTDANDVSIANINHQSSGNIMKERYSTYPLQRVSRKWHPALWVLNWLSCPSISKDVGWEIGSRRSENLADSLLRCLRMHFWGSDDRVRWPLGQCLRKHSARNRKMDILIIFFEKKIMLTYVDEFVDLR